MESSLQLVTEIKRKYVASFGLGTYDFKTWIAKLGKQGYHDIFDCLHINQKDEGMHLIGARSVETGEHLPYYKLIDAASAYEIKVVDLERKTLEQLLVDMKQMKSNEKEGWVINVDGHYVKVKCDDYVNMHRLLDRVSSVNVIIEAIANEAFDDLVSKIPDSYKERVNNVANLIFTYLKKTKQQINEWYAKAPKKTQKEFMIWVEQNVPQHIKPYVRSEYLGVEYNLLKKASLATRKCQS